MYSLSFIFHVLHIYFGLYCCLLLSTSIVLASLINPFIFWRTLIYIILNSNLYSLRVWVRCLNSLEVKCLLNYLWQSSNSKGAFKFYIIRFRSNSDGWPSGLRSLFYKWVMVWAFLGCQFQTKPDTNDSQRVCENCVGCVGWCVRWVGSAFAYVTR